MLAATKTVESKYLNNHTITIIAKIQAQAIEKKLFTVKKQ